MQDRYGNELATGSERAFDLYCRGMDRFLAAQPGAIDDLTEAVAADDGFAIAHADLARMLQVHARAAEAGTLMSRARELTGGLSDRERSHVEIMGTLVAGQGAAAYKLIQEHIVDFPRDILTVQPCCGVFGLIGFSGRQGRETENLAFMSSLQKHYAGDWWFESQHAFALCEVGQLDQAQAFLERALEGNPENANAVHHQAHLRYECGEPEAGRSVLSGWRETYDRQGILFGHLAWHDALWSLELGDTERMWAIVRADILPEVSSAVPLNALTDLIAILLRAELSGLDRQMPLWQAASSYAEQYFPRPGIAFADIHSVVAHAIVENDSALEPFFQGPAGPAGDLVGFVAEAFKGYAAGDWDRTVSALTPIMAVHERLGGSRAQRDFLELTLDFALKQQGRNRHQSEVYSVRSQRKGKRDESE